MASSLVLLPLAEPPSLPLPAQSQSPGDAWWVLPTSSHQYRPCSKIQCRASVQLIVLVCLASGRLPFASGEWAFGVCASTSMGLQFSLEGLGVPVLGTIARQTGRFNGALHFIIISIAFVLGKHFVFPVKTKVYDGDLEINTA